MFQIDPERYYSEAELRDMVRCSRATLARHRRAGKLLASRIGGQVIYEGHNIRRWLSLLASEWERGVARRQRPNRERYEETIQGGEEDETEYE